MKVRFGSLKGSGLVVLSFVLALSALAQDKAPKKGAVNIQGKVTAIKKDTSTITVEVTPNTGTAGPTPRQVMYTASTNFLYGHSDDNKPGMVDKVQMGNFISCAGTMSKGVLTATECVYREKI